MNTKFFLILVGFVLVIGVAIVMATSQRSQQAFGPFNGPFFTPDMFPPEPPDEMKAGSQGLYVFAGPTLVKYSSDGLKVSGKLDLLPKPNFADNGQQIPPPMHGNLDLVKSSTGTEYVLAIADNKLLVIDSGNLKIKHQISLPVMPLPEQGGPGMDRPGPMGGPGPMGPGGNPMEMRPHGQREGHYKMVSYGDIVYIANGPQATEINFVTGKIIGKADLFKQITPKNAK